MKLHNVTMVPEGDGVDVKRLFPLPKFMNFDPFVLFDHFDIAPGRGFPDHPHRGFEAITYMFDGGMNHKDNLGNESFVTAGGAQRFTAGSGLVHSEMPAENGKSMGIQLWINLPKNLKQIDPDYQQVNTDEFPVKKLDGGQVKILVGDGSPLKLKTEVIYQDVQLDNIAEYHLAISNEMRGIIYVTNDLTIFQLFQIPELATFKLYFWGKTGMGFSRFEDKLFSMDFFKDMHETIEKIARLYVKIPTIEIIGEDAINTLLRQVKYNLVSGFFKNKEDALLLCDKISELVKHFQKQSELGYKFLYGTKPAGIEGNYTLYYNEILMIDGIVLLKMDDNRITYITTNPMNYIHTTNSDFYKINYKWIKNLIKKSKERNRFFLRAQEKISDLKKEIE